MDSSGLGGDERFLKGVQEALWEHVPQSAATHPAALRGSFALLFTRLLLLLPAWAAFHLAYLAIGERIEPRNLADLAVAAVGLIAYWELAHGRSARGMGVLCWGLWLTTCLWACLVAGLRTPLLFAIPAVVVFTVWVLGRAAASLMGLASLLALGLITLADYQGWLPTPVLRTSLDLFISYSEVVFFAVVLACVVAANFDQAYRDQATQLDTLRTRDAERELEFGQISQQLKDARDELLEAEKLAALGSMVASVSHELNTPLGNALLATSALSDQLHLLNENLKQGTIKRSWIEHFLAESVQSADLAIRSLERAAALVKSFKQLAVDQTSGQRRSFDLAQEIGNTITSLRPRYKNEPWELRVDIAPDIILDSYPGPLGQIVLNLVMNSILHGFDGRDHGVLSISGYLHQGAKGSADEVILVFADDGVGIPAEHLARVFDPFFTTRGGRGGSGIGLNVVERITREVLGGKVSVESTVGAGTIFTLRIPARAPSQGAAHPN